MVEALVHVKNVAFRGTKRVSMSHESRASNIVIAGDTMSLQVLRQGGKEMQIPGGQTPYCVEVVQRFATEILQQVRSLCAAYFRTLSWKRITPSPRLEDREIFFWRYFASFSVWHGICASTSSTSVDPQKMVVNILPANGVTRYLFLG